MKKLIQFFIAILILSSCTKTTELNQWRGVNRDGVYNETNLLKEWPKEGPELLWEYEGIGNGYGSPTVNSDMVFVNGELDSLSHLLAFNLKGELVSDFEHRQSRSGQCRCRRERAVIQMIAKVVVLGTDLEINDGVLGTEL